MPRADQLGTRRCQMPKPMPQLSKTWAAFGADDCRAFANRSLIEAGDFVFPHPGLQGGPLQPKPGGRPVRSPDHSLGFLQNLQDVRAFGGLADIRSPAALQLHTGRLAIKLRQGNAEFRPAAPNNRPLDDTPQFANIARPVVIR